MKTSKTRIRKPDCSKLVVICKICTFSLVCWFDDRIVVLNLSDEQTNERTNKRASRRASRRAKQTNEAGVRSKQNCLLWRTNERTNERIWLSCDWILKWQLWTELFVKLLVECVQESSAKTLAVFGSQKSKKVRFWPRNSLQSSFLMVRVFLTWTFSM